MGRRRETWEGEQASVHQDMFGPSYWIHELTSCWRSFWYFWVSSLFLWCPQSVVGTLTDWYYHSIHYKVWIFKQFSALDFYLYPYFPAVIFLKWIQRMILSVTPVQCVVGIVSITSLVLGAFYATECIHSHDGQQNDRTGISWKVEVFWIGNFLNHIRLLLFMWELDLWWPLTYLDPCLNGPGGKEGVFSLSGHLSSHSSITVGSLFVLITDHLRAHLWLALFEAFHLLYERIFKEVGMFSKKNKIKHKLTTWCIKTHKIQQRHWTVKHLKAFYEAKLGQNSTLPNSESWWKKWWCNTMANL